MTDQYDEDLVGYWDEHGEYQYYEQHPTTAEQWHGDGGSAPSSPTHATHPHPHTQHEQGTSVIPSSWEIAYDDDSNPYYFNHTTSEWQYEIPDDYIDPYAVDYTASGPAEHELGYWEENGEYVYYDATAAAAEDLNETTTTEDGVTAATSAFTDSQGWQAVDDGYGNLYYYNNFTQEQQWEVPETYTAELNAEAWYNPAVETAAVAFEGSDAEHAAAIRVQSIARRRTANKRVIRKRAMHGNMKDLHSSAVHDTHRSAEEIAKENNAATKMQALLRRKKAMQRSKDMRELAPLLKRVQDCVEAKRLLYGSPIASVDDLFLKIDQDGDGIVTVEEICQALEQLDVGLTDVQRQRLMGAVDVDENGTVDVIEFTRALRLGNAVFHKHGRRKRYQESIPEEGEETEEKKLHREGSLSEAIQWSKEGVAMIEQEKKGKQQSSSSTLLGGTATMSISRVDFLTHHAIHPTEDGDAEEGPPEELDALFAEAEDDVDDENDHHRISSPKPVSPKKHDDIVETTGMKHPNANSLKRIGYLRVQEKKLLSTITLKPNESMGWMKYGYILLEQDKHEEALVKFEKAAELGASTSRLWRSTGHCYYVMDQVKLARPMYTKAIQQHRKDQSNLQRRDKTHQKLPPPMLMLYRAARMDMRRNSYQKAYQKLTLVVNVSRVEKTKVSYQKKKHN